jgi:DNA-binding NtrC family response regulator
MTWSRRPVAEGETAPVTAAHAPVALAGNGAVVTCLITGGPSAGRSFSLSAASCVVGSDAACDVRVEDPTVSRRHAEATFFEGAVQFIDLGSRNAMVFMGQRSQELVLPWDTEVRLGKTTLRFKRPEEVGRSTLKLLAGQLVGGSPAIQQLFFRLERLAARDVAVLFEGPTGVGKEASARAVHTLSARRHGPFVVFDCASAAEDLVEAQLFGVEAGAFTGALKSRAGLIESARGGAVLFDNIDALPLTLQPKLLRLLDSNEFRRVGGNAVKQADFRAFATSQQELLGRCHAGHFRSDLYFRLSSAVVEVPPLTDRREDIEPLARHFALARQVELTAAQLTALTLREYPGNVRQLKHEVERVLLLEPSHPAAPLEQRRLGYNESRDVAVQNFEARYLRELLTTVGGNISQAAKLAGLSRSQFYRVLRRHPSVMKMVRDE